MTTYKNEWNVHLRSLNGDLPEIIRVEGFPAADNGWLMFYEKSPAQTASEPTAMFPTPSVSCTVRVAEENVDVGKTAESDPVIRPLSGRKCGCA